MVGAGLLGDGGPWYEIRMIGSMVEVGGGGGALW